MDQKLLEQLNLEADSANAGYGSDEYFAARFSKGARRHRVWSILALKSAIENIPLTVSDPGVARLKLAWWSNQIQEKDAHPLYRITRLLWADGDLLETSVEQLVNSLDQHYTQQMFASEVERKNWFSTCYQPLYRMLVEHPKHHAHNELCGPIESARSLLRLKDELDRQFVRVSKDVFVRENVDLAAIPADPNAKSLRKLINAQLTSANQQLTTAVNQCSGLKSPALTYALLTKRQLEETIADGGELLARKVELTPLRKFWIAWRNR